MQGKIIVTDEAGKVQCLELLVLWDFELMLRSIS
jgi:hypothetical protein